MLNTDDQVASCFLEEYEVPYALANFFITSLQPKDTVYHLLGDAGVILLAGLRNGRNVFACHQSHLLVSLPLLHDTLVGDGTAVDHTVALLLLILWHCCYSYLHAVTDRLKSNIGTGTDDSPAPEGRC